MGVRNFRNSGIIKRLRELFDRLYYISGSTIYEINPDTYAIINSASLSNKEGVGGYQDRLYATYAAGDDLFELNKDSLVVINSRLNVYDNPRGIGGNNSELFVTGNTLDTIVEVNPETLNIIRSGASPTGGPFDMGGNKDGDRLFHASQAPSVIYELNPATFATVNSAAPVSGPSGIGGTYQRLYILNFYNTNINEINRDTLAIINTGTIAGSNERVGGLAE